MNAPEPGPRSGRLEQLEFDNSFAGLPEAFYTRLAPLGLAIRTVRSRGYLLEAAAVNGSATAQVS